MEKILVTGGAGYIGSHTVVELANAGFAPIIVDDFSNSDPTVIQGLEKIIGEKVVFYTADCKEYDSLKKIFQKEKDIQGVIHFAANKAVGESVKNPLKYYGNNLGSLITLLKVMEEEGVSNLVFSSSCTVYGQPDQLPVNEMFPRGEIESPYGNTKKIGEEIIEDTSKSSGLKAIILRYFNPIGAHPSAIIGELPLGVPSNLVPFVTQTAVGIRENLTIFGNDYNTKDGTCVRDYIHVVDLAKAHVKALNFMEQTEKKGFSEVFNIGTGKGNTVLELVQIFQEVSGEKLNYTIGNRRPGDVEQIWSEVKKANTTLGWKAEYSLKDALLHAWNWQKNLKKEKV